MKIAKEDGKVGIMYEQNMNDIFVRNKPQISFWNRHVHSYVHCSTIHNKQNLETTQEAKR